MKSMISKGLAPQVLGTKAELALVICMVGILLVLFTPIPAGLLDFLLIANFSFGLLILLLTLYMDKPLGFSTFPSLLLIATLFRLSLNIASTRLILSEADAGEVINAVGEYVVGGNYIIGLVVFTILIVVQYVVVTNGAQRVAEVAARFTLDSMPGKQMSIDADLNMGLIDEKEAQTRRKTIEKEANFYGAMDGASKFVKGDAIAGIIIVLINIVGGLTIGLAQSGLTWGEALHTYTLLTVGDGIVTQIPALVISTATGIIVTRAATDAQFGDEITNQITRYPKSLIMVSFALLGLLILPGIPVLPVLVLLCIAAGLAYFAFKNQQTDEDDPTVSKDGENSGESDDLYEGLEIDPIEVRMGTDLSIFVAESESTFMDKVKAFRKQYAQDMGFVFPAAKFKDEPRLNAYAYEFRIAGSKVGAGELHVDKLLAISATEQVKSLNGIATKDPSYGLPAVWIDQHQMDDAKQQGYTIVEPATVLLTHFCEMIRNYAHELLSRAETELMVRRVKESQPNLYEELIPNVLSLSDLQKVFQNLLKEKVSIRQVTQVMECLVDTAKTTKNHDDLTEFVRAKLGRSICEELVDSDGTLSVLSFDPLIEQNLQAGLRQQEDGRITLVVDPSLTEKILRELSRQSEKMLNQNLKPVLLCSPSLRRHIKRVVDRVLPLVSVLSMSEIPNTVNIKSFALLSVEGIANPALAPSLAARNPNAASRGGNEGGQGSQGNDTLGGQYV